MGEQGIAAGKPKKQYLRFVAGFLGIVIFVIAGYFALRFYFRNEEFIKKQKQDQEIIEYYAALEKRAEEDTYGGETPEETLRLFIDALKAGDTDLAAKYFVVEEQEEEKNYLEEVKRDGLIESMIGELNKTQLTLEGDVAFFTLIGKNGIVESELVMRRYEQKGLWKILEL